MRIEQNKGVWFAGLLCLLLLPHAGWGDTSLTLGGGRFEVDAGCGFAADGVVVSSGAVLAGGGAVNGAVSMAGTLSPGAEPATVGILTNTSLTASSGWTLLYKRNASTGDLVTVTGTAALGSETVTVALEDLGSADFSGWQPVLQAGTLTGSPTVDFDYGSTGESGFDSKVENNALYIRKAEVVGAGNGLSALRFDGVDDFVEFGENSPAYDNDALTIETWIRTTSSIELNNIVCWGNSGAPTDNVQFRTCFGKVQLGIDPQGVGWVSAESASTVNDGQWTHVAVVKNGTSVTFYINGKADASGTIDRAPSVDRMLIGKYYNSDGYFDGEIDEVRIWHAVRSEAQIKANMFRRLTGTESGLVAYYPMDEESGTALVDETANALNGTLMNGVERQASGAWSGPRRALTFDGSNDRVVVPNHASIAISGTALTLEAWIKPSSFSAGYWQNTIIDKHNDSEQGYGLRCGGAGILSFNLGAGVVDVWYDVTSAAESLSVGVWTHVAGVYDGSTQRIYVNGRQVGSVARSISIAANTDNLSIGNGIAFADRAFTGQIDEVRIWNVARTADELRDGMMRSLDGDEAGLQAYYRMDLVDGTTLYDQTANGNNGTLQNMSVPSVWSASTAYNTWVGSDDAMWSNAENWSLGTVPGAAQHVGLYEWQPYGFASILTNAQTLGCVMVVGTSAPPAVVSNATLYANGVIYGDLSVTNQGALRGGGDVVGNVVLGDGVTLGAGSDASTVGVLTNSGNMTVLGDLRLVYKRNASTGDLVKVTGTAALGSETVTVALEDLGSADFSGWQPVLQAGTLTGTPTVNFDYGSTGESGFESKIENNALYIRQEVAADPNLVPNGDFEQGNTSFSSDYRYVTYDQTEGVYSVVTNAQTVHPSWISMSDHTADGNQYFIANGSANTSLTVWQTQEPILVTQPNTPYRFEAWVASVYAVNNDGPILSFQIGNGTDWQDMGSSQTFPNGAGGVWGLTYFDGVFDSSGTYYLRLINDQSASNGNDLGVDDIYFGLTANAPSVGENPYGGEAPSISVTPLDPYVADFDWNDGNGSAGISVSSGDTNATYRVLGYDEQLGAAPQQLFETNGVTTFTYNNLNALGSVSRRFYRIVEVTGGTPSTNSTTYVALKKPLTVGSWHKYSLGVNYGTDNRLDGALGAQLAEGLQGDNTKENADLLYIMDAAGNWETYYLDGGESWRVYSSGALATSSIASWQSFWVKRRSGGSNSTPVYHGPTFTSANQITFRAGAWHMIAWPFAEDRREDDGEAGQQGWGFAAAGGQKGTSWLNSDLLAIGEGSQLRYYYLYTSGRWCPVGSTSPAGSLTMRLGESYYYLHRGSGFSWTASEP